VSKRQLQATRRPDGPEATPREGAPSLRAALPAASVRPAVRILALTGALALALSGCQNSSPPPLAPIAEPARPVVAQPSSENAFDHYLLAAQQAARLPKEKLFAETYTPGLRKAVLNDLKEPLAQLIKGTRKRCEWRYEPPAYLEPIPEMAGYQILAKALTWQIEAAVKERAYGRALDLYLIAAKFGTDMSGGASFEAVTGFAIIDQARQALAPALPEMSPQGLQRLALAQTAILRNAPTAQQVLDHELQAMKSALQAYQDAFAKGTTKDLSKKLGFGGDAIVAQLDALSKESPENRQKFFGNLTKEAEAEILDLRARAAKPTRERAEYPDLGAGGRPYWRIARAALRGGRVYLEARDYSLAWGRLLVAYSQSMARLKKTGTAPTDLAGIAAPIRLDPFTGRNLIYRAQGSDFLVYSVGSNLRDDGGSTDESFRAPDLRLEVR